MSHIWTRRTKIIEPKDPVIMRARVCGLWKLEAIKSDGRRRVLADWFPNLIVDVGLDLPGLNGGFLQSCVVGTGNSAPDVSDTGLDNQIALTTTRQSVTSGSNEGVDRYTWARSVWRFSAGAAAGNLAEIGIRSQAPDQMLSRALILDGDGDPTTITVLSDEVLDATYEFRLYPPLVDTPGEMTVSGEDYDVVVRAGEVDNFWTLQHGGLGAGQGFSAGVSNRRAQAYQASSVLGAVTSSPSGSLDSSSTGTASAYSSGTYRSDISYTWTLDQGNLSGGIGAIFVNVGQPATSGGEGASHMAFQMSVDPPLPKDNTNNLSLGFRTTWARKTL